MRFLIYADPHWSSYSSILRKRGAKYSKRLENLIDTMNFIEDCADENNCDEIVCLGDFFDKCELNPEEITALNEINWSNKSHTFIVGNHELGRSSLEFSSAHLFNLIPNSTVIDSVRNMVVGDTNILYLPYIFEKDRKPLKEYLSNNGNNNIVFSHNDIKGVQMGVFESKEGFELSDIDDNCSLFFNGHIHNGSDVSKALINVGNITGQNFSEDGFKYTHKAYILDTDTHSLSEVQNESALNFYKMDLTKNGNSIYNFDGLKNAVVSARISASDLDEIRKIFDDSENIVEYRLTVESDCVTADNNTNVVVTEIDHIKKFSDYVIATLDKSEYLEDELLKVVG